MWAYVPSKLSGGQPRHLIDKISSIIWLEGRLLGGLLGGLLLGGLRHRILRGVVLFLAAGFFDIAVVKVFGIV